MEVAAAGGHRRIGLLLGNAGRAIGGGPDLFI
jgi:hypothetical protein